MNMQVCLSQLRTSALINNIKKKYKDAHKPCADIDNEPTNLCLFVTQPDTISELIQH
jgi:hypothetical protein